MSDGLAYSFWIGVVMVSCALGYLHRPAVGFLFAGLVTLALPLTYVVILMVVKR